MEEYKLNEMEQAIYGVLKDWNLNCSDDDDLKEELAKQIEQAVIKLNKPAVSNRRELLIAFATEMQNIGFNEMDSAEKVVDIWLKSN